MGRFLIASVLAGGFSIVHLLVLRRATLSLLSDGGSFTRFLLSTTMVRFGSVLVVFVASLVGGVGAALGVIAGLWCVRTWIFVFALSERAL